MRFEPGAGISDRRMASAPPSSKRRPMRVLKALTRKPMIMRFITRKMTVPRRIVSRGAVVGEQDFAIREGLGGEVRLVGELFKTASKKVFRGIIMYVLNSGWVGRRGGCFTLLPKCQGII